ncbi:unnamed protein product [Peniophora sp. CBMAI 1063]|nr:unnamed protein product [Peniophora sp. CBMAI 1063]
MRVPHIGESVKRLWADVTRYGPKLPDIKLPGLGEFEILPSPPPPPPPRFFWDRSTDWVADHPLTATGIGAGAVGATLLVGYKGLLVHRGRRTGKGKHSSDRKQVVVVLGGDTPLALTLSHELKQKGYIVIASASTSDAASEIEHQRHGYVRALVLDPLLPDSVPNFLRLLVSALSRRFPIDAGGDPHASPASMPYIHSVISLLGLSSPALPPPGPLEHLQLVHDYMPYLTTTHIVLFMVVQALLPLLRSSSHINGKGKKKSVVFCVAAADSHAGLPFSAASAMSVAATARGAEVLRLEIAMAAATGGASTMKDINVVVMDVSHIQSPTPTRRRMLGHDAHNDLESWTESEQLAYGPAYKAMAERTKFPASSSSSRSNKKPSKPSSSPASRSRALPTAPFTNRCTSAEMSAGDEGCSGDSEPASRLADSPPAAGEPAACADNMVPSPFAVTLYSTSSSLLFERVAETVGAVRVAPKKARNCPASWLFQTSIKMSPAKTIWALYDRGMDDLNLRVVIITQFTHRRCRRGSGRQFVLGIEPKFKPCFWLRSGRMGRPGMFIWVRSVVEKLLGMKGCLRGASASSSSEII